MSRVILMFFGMLVLPSFLRAEPIDVTMSLFGRGEPLSGLIEFRFSADQGTGGGVSQANQGVDLPSSSAPISSSDIQRELDAGGRLVVESPTSAILIPQSDDRATQVIVPGPDETSLLAFRFCELMGTCTTTPQ